MTPEPLIVPSEALLALRQAGHETWMRSDVTAESVLAMTGVISDRVAQALPGADWIHVGWAIFAVGAQVVVKNEAYAELVRGAIPRSQVLLGVRRGAELTCRVGDALINRREQPPSAPTEGAFQVSDFMLKARPRWVDGAESVLPQLLPGAEAVAAFSAVIRGREGAPGADGMVAMLAPALPGIDATQAGWGLVVCGTSLLSLADAAVPESKGRRLLRRRRPQEGADLLGTALVGSLTVMAGDSWIESSAYVGR
jgi:hypothetical protein